MVLAVGIAAAAATPTERLGTRGDPPPPAIAAMVEATGTTLRTSDETSSPRSTTTDAGSVRVASSPDAAAARAEPEHVGPVPAPPTGVTGRLRVEGRWLVDQHGRVMLLHGVNNVDKSPPYMTLDDGFTLNAEDAELLATHGFNTVRLGVEFDGLMPTRGVIDQAYLDRITSVVDLLGDAGIHVLLDNHQDGLSPVWGGNGFPAWAIRARPLPLEPNPGFPLYYLMPSMNLGWTEVWNNTYGAIDYLGEALAALAGRLRGHPAVLGIELMNEPWPGLATPTCFPVGCPLFDTQMQQVWTRLTGRIRNADPDVLVFWEPNAAWNETMPTHMDASQPGVVFSFHDYCAFSQLGIYLGIGQQLQDLCVLQHDRTWSNADQFVARTGVPAMATEFGDQDAGVIAATMERADARFDGWHYWHYESAFGPEPEADPLLGDAGRQLVRTYPQATAGTPHSLSLDATSGAFRYVYTARQLDAPTEIYVSDLHYPNGFTVAVEGGQVTSAPEARIVTIEADDGAPVTVAITGLPG